MRVASVAQIKNRLSEFLARSKRRNEPVIITRYGRPYALIQPISERDLETLDWARLAQQQLADAWKDEDDDLYGYL